jgi:hypothetical protein
MLGVLPKAYIALVRGYKTICVLVDDVAGASMIGGWDDHPAPNLLARLTIYAIIAACHPATPSWPRSKARST